MNLLQEMKLDPIMFFRYTRMTLPLFNNLLEKMRAHLMKKIGELYNRSRDLLLLSGTCNILFINKWTHIKWIVFMLI